MPIELVRPLKLETLTAGGELDFGPTEVDPLDDTINAKSFAFESDVVNIVDLSTDKNVRTLSLSGVLFNKTLIPDDLKNYIISTDHQHISFDLITVDGLLTIDGDCVIFT